METMNEFFEWWMVKHYILSTIITPQITLAWALYKGLWWRGIASFFLWSLQDGDLAVNRNH